MGATLLSFIYWAFGFLRMGTVGLTAQAHGAQDAQRLMQLLFMPGLLALVIGLGIMALQSWLIPLGVSLMGASTQVSGLAQEYLTIRVYSAPAVLVTGLPRFSRPLRLKIRRGRLQFCIKLPSTRRSACLLV